MGDEGYITINEQEYEVAYNIMLESAPAGDIRIGAGATSITLRGSDGAFLIGDRVVTNDRELYETFRRLVMRL
jgi:hypothetical protein